MSCIWTRKRHISVLPCTVPIQRRLLKHLWCWVRARHVHNHRVIKDVGEGWLIKLLHKAPSKIPGTSLLWWMRRSVEAARAGEMWWHKWCHNLQLKCIPQLRVPKVTAGCQRTLLMANYHSCGGPLIPAHGAVKYGILLSDHNLISPNKVMQLNRMIWFWWRHVKHYGSCW